MGIELNNALKMLVGVIIFVLGAWTMVNPSWFRQSSWIYGLNWWIYTWDIIKGSVGPLLILIGLIVVWITYEEPKP
ncbi:Uncharacterised protein [uncultured archaeon]|nr:Uncharacterised protein [uncultured archaeon]